MSCFSRHSKSLQHKTYNFVYFKLKIKNNYSSVSRAMSCNHCLSANRLETMREPIRLMDFQQNTTESGVDPQDFS